MFGKFQKSFEKKEIENPLFSSLSWLSGGSIC